MYKKTLIITMILICGLVISTSAQSSNKLEKTTLIDEFPILQECDRGARMDAFIVALQRNPNSKGYVLTYLGSKDVLRNQSDEFSQKMLRMLRLPMEFRGFDMSRVSFIDAGFRESDSIVNQLWLVPEGGEIPKPKDVVPKPKTPTDRAYLADRNWVDFDEVSFETINNKVQEEIDLINYENVEDIIVESEFDEDYEKILERQKYFMSDTFISELEKNKTSKGIVFYYADAEKYHLGNAQEFLQKNLQEYGKKYEIDVSNIRIIYGGYSKSQPLEFWIVPKNAPDAVATPEQKELQKNK